MADSVIPRPTRPFSLAIYALIVFAVSWPLQIAGALLANSPYTGYILNASSMLMVPAGTLLAGRLVFRDGFAQAGWRWGTIRQHVTAVGLILLVWVAPTVVANIGGAVHLPDCLTAEQAGRLFINLVVTFLPAFGEEFGWRGYLLPRLAARMSPRRAVLLHSVVWWPGTCLSSLVWRFGWERNRPRHRVFPWDCR